jgi:hypothetical protein
MWKESPLSRVMASTHETLPEALCHAFGTEKPVVIHTSHISYDDPIP